MAKVIIEINKTVYWALNCWCPLFAPPVGITWTDEREEEEPRGGVTILLDEVADVTAEIAEAEVGEEVAAAEVGEEVAAAEVGAEVAGDED